MIERKQLVSKDKIETKINDLHYNPKMTIEARNNPDIIKGFNSRQIIETRNETPKEGFNGSQIVQTINSNPQQEVQPSSSNSSDDKNDG